MTALRQRTRVTMASIPSLPRYVRIQYDPLRQAYAVLAPEKVFWPNEISLDILRKCDGARPVSGIVAELAMEYEAAEEDVAPDVIEFLQEWSDKLLVRA